MDLTPCNEEARTNLINSLCKCDQFGNPDLVAISYVAKTFPSILVDVVRHLSNEAHKEAHDEASKYESESHGDNSTQKSLMSAIHNQLQPFIVFHHLLGKCPQVSSFIYEYFETSHFQPLPPTLFKDLGDGKIGYEYFGFDDSLLHKILVSYFKYLTYDTKWFSCVWNWSELGRLSVCHDNYRVRYIAACCLSLITRPTRNQHLSYIRNTVLYDVPKRELESKLCEVQLNSSPLYDNNFRPCIETKLEQAQSFANAVGLSATGYPYCHKTFTKISNILLCKKRDSKVNKSKLEIILNKFLPIDAFNEPLSQISYSISVNKPCLILGSCGSGKTSIIDYIAAKTGRLNPPDYIKLQVGDQIDSRQLIGSYVCTDIPGQFEWQAGPLTKAIAFGSWIVFDDIDLAPSDMIQIIHSVIENKNLTCIPNCPLKLDSPHPDFRIFFTQKRNEDGQSIDVSKLGLNFIYRLCDIIEVPQIDSSDIITILEKKFGFKDLAKEISKLYLSTKETLLQFEGRGNRILTNRDLMKLCKRISNLKIDPASTNLTSTDMVELYKLASECFIGYLEKKKRNECSESLAANLQISSNKWLEVASERIFPIRDSVKHVEIGVYKLKKTSDQTIQTRSTFAYHNQSLNLLSKIAACVQHKEPVLLVGETGVGKTCIVQHLASLLGTQLTVINLSQQSDSSDLLGGYRPANMHKLMEPINLSATRLYQKTYNQEKSEKFLRHMSTAFARGASFSKWSKFLTLVVRLCASARQKKELTAQLANEWQELLTRAQHLLHSIQSGSDTASLAMAFTEGSLVQAVKTGGWILLDEINLAEVDVLQCLLQILDSVDHDYVYLSEFPEEASKIKIHPDFRLFACMNPATDVGKRDLPIGVRNRFSEYFVDDITDRKDLKLIIESYMKNFKHVDRTIDFYLRIRSKTSISDVAGNCPNFNLRTLCRAMSICSNNICLNTEKTLLESLKITFFQQLNQASHSIVMKDLEELMFPKGLAGLQATNIPKPKDGKQYEQVEGFWIECSKEVRSRDKNYIVTKSVAKNMQTISRIISLGQRKLPVLIQGNTSVGKTSLIKYIADLTGNKCVRINNHEHTDLEEYIGRHVLDQEGRLVYQEGILVKAMRDGHWIILDELNLAPSELLEALNRVLDDNREIYIPETKLTVRANPSFMLFATQNPPESYSGRKLLSRAFRSRFIEINFDEIPHDELENILHKRCEMPPTYAKDIVAVMKELQIMRRESDCFHGKTGFVTLRDIFRWGERYLSHKKTVPDGIFFDWKQQIAKQGLILLEGKVRTSHEADIVKSTIEKVFNLKLDRSQIYGDAFKLLKKTLTNQKFETIVFTHEFRMLYVQIATALEYKEPVLLCGPTGCGKTTAAQLYAISKKLGMSSYNCHQNSESSDFIGSIRPSRSKNSSSIFSWVDGPLITAMKKGNLFLMDEISLADDAVLERINSVLEPDRTLTLTENVGESVEASSKFRFVATMNPGGDFGKKELSTALRNRLTEIYCHESSKISEIMDIVIAHLSKEVRKCRSFKSIITVMQQFINQFFKLVARYGLREVISWVTFINKTTDPQQLRPLSIQESLINGASLVYLDQFGSCGFNSILVDRKETPSSIKHKLKFFLKNQVQSAFGKEPKFICEGPCEPRIFNDVMKFKKFTLRMGPHRSKKLRKKYIFDVPIVKRNLMKLVRAMQLDRPILLEGDPGVGKTSLITSLAEITGHKLVRFNLSEQTDISDLFGSDLPDNSSMDAQDTTPKFSWHDGPLLQALKNSDWILLDELNLASQSILEGLNACFDHRSEIHIPELSKTFKVDRTSTRIFATQNPYSQGASRKGLPQSFLNRFSSIFIDSLKQQDLKMILSKINPHVPMQIIQNMVKFNEQLIELEKMLITNVGSDFNLRDLVYWLELMTCSKVSAGDFAKNNLYQPERFVQFVYLDRFRKSSDREIVSELFERIFNIPIYEPAIRELKFGETCIILSRSILPRITKLPPHLSNYCVLKFQLPILESIMSALYHRKMPIVVGQTGIGKRTMIKILAGLSGYTLNVISANYEMDTIELLGSYEQKSWEKSLSSLIEKVKYFVFDLFNTSCERKSYSSWSQVSIKLWTLMYEEQMRGKKMSSQNLLDSFKLISSQLEELVITLKTFIMSDGQSRKLSALEAEYKNLFDSNNTTSPAQNSGNFEWIDSILIKSMKEGSWMLIENANLMNPATLDRLNSLVEPNGTISLNEKGADSEGNVEIIVPHENFRLLLTMDPMHGELSRAMKNRGIEIFVEPIFFYEDFMVLLYQNGYVPVEERTCMAYSIMQTCLEVHKKITEEPDGGPLVINFALNYTTLLTHLVRRGKDVGKTLTQLLKTHYSRNGYSSHSCIDDNLSEFVEKLLAECVVKNKVSLNDARYLWVDYMYDLFQLSGGDAITSTISRDYKILSSNINRNIEQINILRPDESIECMEFVIYSTQIKIFLEHASHSDLNHRLHLISWYNKSETVQHCLKTTLKSDLEYLRKLKDSLPVIQNGRVQSSEIYIDTRNCPDLHYQLLSENYEKFKKLELSQNRWLLTAYSSMLNMILEHSIKQQSDRQDLCDSLFTQARNVVTGRMDARELVRTNATVASDLVFALEIIVAYICKRSVNDDMIADLKPKLFWLFHFLCKLKKRSTKQNLIIVCNQLPTIWTLTYYKVIKPVLRDFNLKDLRYRDAKLSRYLDHVCQVFKTLEKGSSKFVEIEKGRHKSILNICASTTASIDNLKREMMKFFNSILEKQLSRHRTHETHIPGCPPTNAEYDLGLSAFKLACSNSKVISSLHAAINELCTIELNERSSSNWDADILLRIDSFNGPRDQLKRVKDEFVNHERLLAYEAYRLNFFHDNRLASNLSQFSPLWQVELFFKKLPTIVSNLIERKKKFSIDTIDRMLKTLFGIIISPNLYYTLSKILKILDSNTNLDEFKTAAINLQLFYMFIVELTIELPTIDTQIYGWSKMRNVTSDLYLELPRLPERFALISYVSCFCLNAKHLRIASYNPKSMQINSFLLYCWNNYYSIKANQEDFGLGLAKKLLERKSVLVKTNQRNIDIDKIYCDLESYLATFLSSFSNYVEPDQQSIQGWASKFINSIRLICFGFLVYKENEPLFTIDPALKAREKLDIYKSELAHIKLELYLLNTLFYWKSGENLRLEEIVDLEETSHYPFSQRILIHRRIRLEEKIGRLSAKYSQRPLNDDGSQYFNLRSEVEYIENTQTSAIFTLLQDLKLFSTGMDNEIVNLSSKFNLLIKNLEKCIKNLKSRYSLYADILTNFLAGLSLVLIGLRSIHAELIRQVSVLESKFNISYLEFLHLIENSFSLNNHTTDVLTQISYKRKFMSHLSKIHNTQKEARSYVLISLLNQMRNHIIVNPSHLNECVAIYDRIAANFSKEWIELKTRIESFKKKKEELYQYKTSATTLNSFESFPEQKQLLDVYTNFPTYEHCYKDFLDKYMKTTDSENLRLEEAVINLDEKSNAKQYIEICYALMNFTFAAALSSYQTFAPRLVTEVDFEKVYKNETDLLYSFMSNTIQAMGPEFDAILLEYYILNAVKLIKLNTSDATNKDFDIYRQSDPQESLRIQSLCHSILVKVYEMLKPEERTNDVESKLSSIMLLSKKIGSFLLEDPLMKFVTGAQSLLEMIDYWNKIAEKKEYKLIDERQMLVEILKDWRKIELQSWYSALARTKKLYQDNAMYQMWFEIYSVFAYPVEHALNFLESKNVEIKQATPDLVYNAILWSVKEFLEASTLGDYQIRLKLLVCFCYNTLFSCKSFKIKSANEANSLIDSNKLVTCIFNLYLLYSQLFKKAEDLIKVHEDNLQEQIKRDTSIVKWQDKNFWDVRNSFKDSYRRLNKVINQYKTILEVSISRDEVINPDLEKKPVVIVDSERISADILGIQIVIDNVSCPKPKDKCLKASKYTKNIVRKMIELNKDICKSIATKYPENILGLEKTMFSIFDHTSNFYSHKVQDVVIKPSDKKEQRDEKTKLCRQMYHSKKFTLNYIFKELQQCGISYLRGNNSMMLLDDIIYKGDPLLSLNSNFDFLHDAKPSLVSNNITKQLVDTCIVHYYELLSANMALFSQTENKDSHINGETLMRMRGFSLDMILNVTKHQQSVSNLLKNIFEIEKVYKLIARLDMLNSTDKHISVIEYRTFKGKLNALSDIVERSLVLVDKISRLQDAASILNLDRNNETDAIGDTLQATPQPQQVVFQDEEYKTISMLLEQSNEENALVSSAHLFGLDIKLSKASVSLKAINDKLKPMLGYTIKSHFFTPNDISIVEDMKCKLVETLESVRVDCAVKQEKNISSGIMNQIDYLLRLTKELDVFSNNTINDRTIGIEDHPNLRKLDIRLSKVVRQVMIVMQQLYVHECSIKDSKTADNKKVFLLLNHDVLMKDMNLESVLDKISNLMITINMTKNNSNIYPVIEALKPLMHILIHLSASYMNVMLTALQIKLAVSTHAVNFFVDLHRKGFGLPTKMIDSSEPDDGNLKGSADDDCKGFGEGGEGDENASKRVEFESQLDELKSNKEEQATGSKETADIEAKDDAIEMSDDIGGEARGSDEVDETKETEVPDDNQNDGAGEDENIDKELDTVEKDEGHLDENIWGEQSDIENDDEEDLKNANDATQTKSSKDLGLMPQDDQALDDDSAENREKKAQESSEDELNEEALSNHSGFDDDTQAEGEFNVDDETEAVNTAIENAPEECKEPDAEEDIHNPIDMDIADNNSDIIDVEGSFEELNEDVEVDEKAKNQTDEQSKDELDNELSEELDKKDEEKNVDLDNSESQSFQINDDLLDHRLDQALDKNTQADTLPDDDIVDRVKGIQSNDQSDDQNDFDIEHTSKKVGDFNVFDAFPEQDDEPIDYDDIISDVDKPMQEASKQSSDALAIQDDAFNKPEVKKTEESLEEKDETKSKRTLAEASQDTSEERPSKKARIIDNKTKEQNPQDDSESIDRKPIPESGTFKHIEQNSSRAVEMIDLISDDDENQSIPEDPGAEVSSKPRSLLNDPNNKKLNPEEATQDQEETEKVDNVAADSSPRIEDVDNTKEDENKKPKESSFSPISEDGSLKDSVDEMEELQDVLQKKESQVSSYKTNYGLLKYLSQSSLNKENKRFDDVMQKIEIELKNNKSDSQELVRLWSDMSREVNHLTQQLCQQLQIVLQPTKMSKYKGDYKTGKRLNMRKIVGFIASNYRKDKIWLRRTKPNKRNYQILLAVDNSYSMSENDCPQMTFQSLALLSKSLSIIESGSLGVATFGQEVKLIHDFSSTYTEQTGASWLHDMRFKERRTSYSKMLQFSYQQFSRLLSSSSSSTSALVSSSQLLVIISDGRNVSTEEDDIKANLIRLRSIGVMVLFIIIDNLSGNKSSIMELKRCDDKGDGVIIQNYMALFPFPFYVLLRDLNTMPSILGEALRQWFELLSTSM